MRRKKGDGAGWIYLIMKMNNKLNSFHLLLQQNEDRRTRTFISVVFKNDTF